MGDGTRWTIGLLVALVIGLAVALAIVAGDDGRPTDTVTVSTEETEQTETSAEDTEPETTETGSTGGLPSGGGSPGPTSGLD